MATVTLNPVAVGTSPQITQRGGIYQELRFSALVSGLTETDNAVLEEAIDAAAAAHSNLVPGGASTNYPGLFCDEISVRMNGTDTKSVIIDYTFRRKSASSVTYLGVGYHDNGAQFTWSGGTALTQHETPWDAYGNPIVVSHAWQGTELDQAAPTGTTSYISSPISVQLPLTTVTGRGFLTIAYPDLVSKAFTGYVNSDIWAGEPPGTWMCTSVTWEPSDTNTSPVTFEFSFTFEHNPQGFQPLVWFINPRTGTPPHNVVSGVGVRQIVWYPSRPFYPYFPV